MPNKQGCHLNLKGKKHALLSCGCCEVENRKESIMKKIHLQEIVYHKTGIYGNIKYVDC